MPPCQACTVCGNPEQTSCTLSSQMPAPPPSDKIYTMEQTVNKVQTPRLGCQYLCKASNKQAELTNFKTLRSLNTCPYSKNYYTCNIKY